MIVNPILSASSTVLQPKTVKEMLSVIPAEDGRFTIRINSSSLGIIQECLRKAQYTFMDKWKAENEAPATLFGSAIHAALEVFYTGKPDQRRLPKLETLETMSYGHKVKGEEEDLILKATRAFITKGQPLAPVPETDKRSLQNGVWLLYEYFKKFIDDPFTAHSDSHGLFIERVFTLPYISTKRYSVELFGTIDFVFRNVITGDLLPGDHKTSSSLSFGESSYFDRERPNHQYTIYMLALRKLYGIEVEDFMVNIFEVKTKPKTTRGSGPSFPRQITKRTEDDFKELEDVVMESVERYLHAINRNRFPLGPVDACNKYSGCQYKQVCAAPISMRQTILRNKFKQQGEVNEIK